MGRDNRRILFCAQAHQEGKLLHEKLIVKPKNLTTASQTLLTGSITSMGLCENTTALPLLLLLWYTFRIYSNKRLSEMNTPVGSKFTSNRSQR